MRRLGCLGVALAAFLAMSSSVSGEPQAMKTAEWGKIASSLEPYFREMDWQRRDGALLRRVEQVAADLDARRARSRKGSCLADVAGIRRAVYKSQSYKSIQRRGFRRITWNDSSFPGPSPVFWLSVPKRYRPKSPAPLILALHPLGMDAEAYGMRALLRSKVIQDQYFVVAPMWPDSTKATWGAESGEGAGRLLVPLNYVLQKFFIDPDRVYVVGEAEGGTAALDMAMSFGDRFAGIFAVGGGRKKKRALEANLKGLPVHRLKRGNAGPNEATYDEILAKMEGDGGLRRQAIPRKIDWRFGGLWQESAWWIWISRERPREDEKDPGHICVEIKDGNIIDVTTEGVDAFRILLNDEIMNLDEEVQVIINGTKQAPWKAERKLAFAIDWMMEVGDLGRIFLAAREFVVPIENDKDDGEKKDGPENGD